MRFRMDIESRSYFVTLGSIELIQEGFTDLFISKEEKAKKDAGESKVKKFMDQTHNDYFQGNLNGGEVLSNYHRVVERFIDQNKDDKYALKKFKSDIRADRLLVTQIRQKNNGKSVPHEKDVFAFVERMDQKNR